MVVYNPRSEMSVRMLWNTPAFPTDDCMESEIPNGHFPSA
jgi:hypothetical protein